MNEIATDLAAARALLADFEPIPFSIEMHPILYREVTEALREEILLAPLGCPSVYGLEIRTNVKLKPWACVVRDARGKVIRVLKLTKPEKVANP